MAYQASDVILDDHYNIFVQGGAVAPIHTVDNLNSVWGVGNGNKGWGQGNELSPVLAPETITATQWSSLFARLDAVAAQEVNTITGATLPTGGDVVTAIATLQADVTDVYDNRFDNPDTPSNTAVNKSSTNWTVNMHHTCTSAFGDGDMARYFFNTGGNFQISGSTSGGFASAKNDEWTDLIDKMGTLTLNHNSFIKTGGGGVVDTINNIGYYDLTTSYQLMFRQFADTSPYTANKIEVYAKVVGTPGANADNGATVEFEVRYIDDADDSLVVDEGINPADVVDINIVTLYDFRPSTTTFVTSSWGSLSTFSVTETAKT